jgi:hypothetical protein
LLVPEYTETADLRAANENVTELGRIVTGLRIAKLKAPEIDL